MRLLITTVISGIALFLVILTTRIWGQGQQFSEFKHEFLTGPTPYVILKATTIPQMEEALLRKKDVIFWVDARVSADKVMFILPVSQDPKFLESKKIDQEAHPTAHILLGGKLANFPWEQINEFYKTTPSLKEVYEKFPHQRFIVNVIDNTTGINDAVIADLKDLDPDKRTLIQSDTLVIMTSIKDDKPEWVYGTSQADLMRFLSFDSMWILPSTQYKGDVFIAPFTILNRPGFNDDVIAEMRHRHKQIFLGPISTRAQLDEAKQIHAEGYITENLPEFMSWLDESPSH